MVRPPARVLPALVLLLGTACGNSTSVLDRTALEDPVACKTCHPIQYEEWSGSMHAYASEDPVFRAMNKRIQREDPATGPFCAQCHAPLAVRENLTQTGLDLDALPPEKRGVTCYFCHATRLADGTHNNPLVLAKDDSLFGPFGDPAPGTPHKGLYSRLLDGATTESASACGSCHDIQNLKGAHVERTFEEWQGTLFGVSPGGLSCAQCHMPTDGRKGPASTVSTVERPLHSHAMAAIDVAVTPFPPDNPQNDRQKALAQAFLDSSTLQGTLCHNPVSNRLELTIDNIGAGHSFPSGATPDRRVWIEITAYANDQVIYSSGGSSALPLEGSPDPDLWLMRDCLYDGAGGETKMFWQAAAVNTSDPPGAYNQISGAQVQKLSDPDSFSRGHVKKQYPEPGATGMGALPGKPDHVTVKVHFQAIGDDVLADLVATGDLDPAVPSGIARFELGGSAALDWTPATAFTHVDTASGAALTCVTSGTYPLSTAPAASHARCAP